ncbi:hypothetical protein AVEN_33988-1 [Araneus ventricosus]|uniref:Uncharacterized protein n=1 Tax=Araneus ventricosus TaxID=182803 RepID=A0A4Y2E5M2_ARAVE|nr:hypothetical protein AVEN_33988-1 [Araneus ventricosus]
MFRGEHSSWFSLSSLSRPFTSLPKWNFWNTGKKKQSSVLKTDGSWHSGMAKLEFKRTQNPTLHAPIPIWGIDARVAAHQRMYLHGDIKVKGRNESRNFPRRGRGRCRWVAFCDFEPLEHP